MNLKELKKKIYEEDKIIELLEYLECENIKEEQNGNLITARLPDKFDSDNTRSVQVKNNESLYSAIRSRGVAGDIYYVVGYIEYDCNSFDEVRENLYQIVCYICNALDYEINDLEADVKKIDWNYFLREIQKDRKGDYYLNDIPKNKPLDKIIGNEFIPELHLNWFNEGISFLSRDNFDIRYDIKTNRIVFPIHNKVGEIIGWKGRGANDESPKYIYLYPFHKSLEFFNYHRAIEEIKKKKEVIIFESEKSCIKATQWGYENCLGLMGGDLSPVQISILKKLGIETEYIFMWDADKDVRWVLNQVKHLKNRNIKIMIDKNNLLSKENKDSPTDWGKELFDRLYNKFCFPVKGLKYE